MFNQKPLIDNIIDAKSNWWGSVVEDSISKYIFDHEDDDDNTAVVDFSNWLEQKADTFYYEESPGVHYNNIFNNTLFNIFASIPGPNSSVKYHNRKKNESFLLNQNYPNPFNSATTIAYTLANASTVTIEIYDVLGKKIRTLFHDKQNSGQYSVNWNGKNALGNKTSSGVYFYKINTKNFSATRKMVLLF